MVDDIFLQLQKVVNTDGNVNNINDTEFSEENIIVNNLLNDNFGKTKADSEDIKDDIYELKLADTEDIKAVPYVYIISARKGFRPQALRNALESQGYLTQTITIREYEALPIIVNPLCFIIDASDEVNNINVQRSLLYIQEKANEFDIKIHIIAHIEIVEIMLSFMKQNTFGSIFERPVNMKEVINTIQNNLEEQEKHERKKILIIDDSNTTLIMLHGILSPEYEVTMSSSSIDAIKQITKKRFDLLIIDFEMPIVNGELLTKMLRSEGISIPIIFYSSVANPTSILALKEIGISGYIVKTQKGKEIKKYIDNFFIHPTVF